MPLLKCQCCGHEESLTAEEAFQAGWDAPPHFSTHVCCPLCPAVCVVMGAGHKKAHAHWRRHGRPTDFSLAACATDKDWGDAKKIAKARSDMEAIRRQIEG